jgi:hypothetical protein
MNQAPETLAVRALLEWVTGRGRNVVGASDLGREMDNRKRRELELKEGQAASSGSKDDTWHVLL